MEEIRNDFGSISTVWTSGRLFIHYENIIE
jgi:hypothetical protein